MISHHRPATCPTGAFPRTVWRCSATSCAAASPHTEASRTSRESDRTLTTPVTDSWDCPWRRTLTNTERGKWWAAKRIDWCAFFFFSFLVRFFPLFEFVVEFYISLLFGVLPRNY